MLKYLSIYLTTAPFTLREVPVLLRQQQVPGGDAEEGAGPQRALCSHTLLGLQRPHPDHCPGIEYTMFSSF